MPIQCTPFSSMCFARTHVAVQFLICCKEVSNSKTFVTDGTCGTLSPNAGIHDFQHGPCLSTSHPRISMFCFCCVRSRHVPVPQPALPVQRRGVRRLSTAVPSEASSWPQRRAPKKNPWYPSPPSPAGAFDLDSARPKSP